MSKCILFLCRITLVSVCWPLYLLPSSTLTKYTWCLTSTETTRLIRDGENGGKGVWRWGEREIIYTYRYTSCHHQNDLCIKMGSEESHFNASVGSDWQSHKTVSTNHNLLKRKESRSGIEPRSFRLPAYHLTTRPNRLSSTLALALIFITVLVDRA